MKVEIWSDVVCPWCYIGKRRLESALQQFEHADAVEVTWRSFELDPGAPRRREGDLVERLARKYGMTRAQAAAAQARLTQTGAEEGLEFHFDRARPGNTLDAHRLLHLAGERDLQLQGRLKERLLAAYFTEGTSIGDVDTLVRLAAEVGIDEADARAVLAGDEYRDAVLADERTAGDLDVTGVPFFVVDGRYAIAGAQPATMLLRVLERAWADAHPRLQIVGARSTQVSIDPGDSSAEACTDDACAI